jgi:hypothetical protein
MPGITDNIVHVCGLVHRVVEDGRAGWTRHWRPIAEAYPPARSGSEEACAEAEDQQPEAGAFEVPA